MTHASIVRLACGLLMAAAIAAPASAQQRPPSWNARGIGGGGALMDPSFSPHDDRLFVACDMSELFRSNDLGRHWQAVDFAEIQGNRGTHVGFTSDPNRLFAIDHTGELPVPASSSDGGVTWTRPPTAVWPDDRSAYTLFVDRSSTQRVLVGSDDTLWVTQNGGTSYGVAYTSAAGGLHVAGAFFDGTTILVGSSDGLLRSTNGGTSFALVATPGLPADAGFFSFAGAREGTNVRLVGTTVARSALYAGIFVEDAFGSAYRGAFRLEPGQSSWIAANSGIAANDRPVLAAMASDDIDTITLAGARDPNQGEWPIVYRSTNGGANFTSVFRTANNANIATGWAGQGGDRDYSYGGGLIGLGVAPNDAQRIAISDYGFVHVSEDGGAHWRQAYVDPADQHAEGGNVGTGASYRSAGIENTSVWSLAWTDAQHVFAGFSDIRGIRSIDAGVSWSFDYTGHSHNSMYRVVRHVDGSLYSATASVHDMYQSTHLTDASMDAGQGRVLRSTDHGRTWTLVHDFGDVVTWLALDPTNPQRAYASVAHSATGGIFVTNNLGSGSASTWTALAAPPRTERHPYVVAVLADGAIVASYSGRRAPGFTMSSGVFYKADAGAPWQDRSAPGLMYWTKDVVVDPHDATRNTWYAAVFSGWGGAANGLGGLYRTTDRGVHWTRISDRDRVESITVSPTDPDFAWLTTEMEGLWYTTNLRAASPTFTRDATFPFRQPMRVFYNPHDSGEIWVGSFGGGLRVGRVSTDRIYADGFGD